MKRSIIFLSVCLSALIITSCGDNKQNDKQISTSNIKTAVERLAEFQDGYYNTTLTVGYYELNCQIQRENLRKLAANGVITYNAEQINEYDGTLLKTTHVFVNVALTAEGQKCVVEKGYVDSLSKDVDMLNRFASEKYPMDSVGKEIIPVRNPLYAEEGDPEEIKPIETPSIANCEKPTPTLYDLALAKVQTKEVTVIAMKKTVAVVRNVICDELMLAQGNAQADVIIENTEVTAFGRILNKYVKGLREEKHFTFKYYIDRGWDIEIAKSESKDNAESKCCNSNNGTSFNMNIGDKSMNLKNESNSYSTNYNY